MLDDRFGLLVGTDRLAAARQRSLAAAVAWSYELLSEPEGQVFRRLSVFPGPFTLEAAEAVAGGGAGAVVLHLVDCSLVAPPSPGADGRARYLMLETLRAYGADRLAEAGEQDETAAALASYALLVAEQAAAGIETAAGELAAAGWLDAEDATVHYALSWALDHDVPTALRLAIALAPWWRLRGRYTDGYALLHAAAAHGPRDGKQWGTAQVWLGLLASRAGETVGLDHFTAARDALEPSGPSPALVQAVNGRASTLRNTGHLAEAAEEAHRALAMARELGDAPGEATALYNLASTANYADDDQAELAWWRQAQQVDPAMVTPLVARRIGINLAVCLMEMGDIGSARRVAAEALTSAREAGAADLQDRMPPPCRPHPLRPERRSRLAERCAVTPARPAPTSASHGGSAPTRVQVRAATSAAAWSAAVTCAGWCRSDRVSPLRDHQARNAPPKASPAPTVSATGTAGTATLTTSSRRNALAGRGPSVSSTSAGPWPSRAAAAAAAGVPGAI